MSPTKCVPTDILVVVALSTELAHFLECVDQPERIDDTRWTAVRFKLETVDGPAHCTAVSRDTQTDEEARSLTEKAIAAFRPSFVVLIGISGLLSKDLALGDVIVAETVDKYMSRGKFREGGIEHAGEAVRAESDIVNAARQFPSTHADHFRRWQQSCQRAARDALEGAGVTSAAIKRLGLDREPGFHVGPTASGPAVVAGEEIQQTLRNRNRRVLAVDMESGGFLSAIHATQREERPTSLVIRGISDHSDSDKNILEHESKEQNRRIAVHNAALFLRTLLQCVPIRDPQPLTASELRTALHHAVCKRSLVTPLSQNPSLTTVDAKALRTILSVLTSESGDLIESLATAATTSTEKQCITLAGDTGTGKSSACSLLYLLLRERATDDNALTPVLFDLHRYARPIQGAAKVAHASMVAATLDADLRLLERLRTDDSARFVVILDGFDHFQGEIRSLGEQVMKRLTDTDRVVVSTRDGSRQSYCSREVHTQFALHKLISQSDQFDKACRALDPERVAGSTDSIRQMLDPTVDLWTLTRAISARKAHKTATLGSTLQSYCETRLGAVGSQVSIADIAKYAYNKYVSHKVPRLSHAECLEFDFLFSHDILRSFLIATHIVNSIERKGRPSAAVIKKPYPATITRRAKELVQSHGGIQDAVVEILKQVVKAGDKNPESAPIALLYLAGRLDDRSHMSTAKELLTEMLSWFDGDLQTQGLLARRTIVISLAYLGDHDVAREYVERLIADHREDQVNRGFHLEYYGDVKYNIKNPMVSSDTHLETCNTTYLELTASLDPSSPMFSVQVYTLFSLAQHRHAVGKWTDDKRLALVHLAKRLIDSGGLFQMLRDYVSMVATHLEDRNFSCMSLIQGLMEIKVRPRSGWSRHRIDNVESVADHMYGCVMIAYLLLNDAEVKTHEVARLLFVHDLAEALTGDIIAEAKRKEDLDLERATMRQIGLYGTYGQLPDTRWIDESFMEFSAGTTREARLARDIDKLENLLQAYVYFKSGQLTDVEMKDWHTKLLRQIASQSGQELALQMKRHFMPDDD